MVRYRSSKNTDVAHRGIVERGHEPVHRSCIATHHLFFEGNSLAELCVVAIGIDESIRQVLDGMTAGASANGIPGSLAREPPAVFMREIEKVVAVLRRPDEIAVFAELIQAIGLTELLPSRRVRNMRAKHWDTGPEMGPQNERGDRGRRNKGMAQLVDLRADVHGVNAGQDPWNPSQRARSSDTDHSPCPRLSPSPSVQPTLGSAFPLRCS